MKQLEIAYCVVRKNSRVKYPAKFAPLLWDERMPVYWNKKVAKEKADKIGGEVLKVVVEPYENINDTQRP